MYNEHFTYPLPRPLTEYRWVYLDLILYYMFSSGSQLNYKYVAGAGGGVHNIVVVLLHYKKPRHFFFTKQYTGIRCYYILI